MSIRSAARLAARSARPASSPLRTQVVARRAASSGGHKAPSGDLTWALGSAVVFLPLGAYVLRSRGAGQGTDHAHDNHFENPGANPKQTDQHGRSGLATTFEEPDHLKNEGKAEGNSGGADNADDAPGANPEKQAAEQAEVIDSPKEAKAVAEQGGAVNKAAAAMAGATQDKKDEEKEDKSGDKKSDESEKDDSSDERAGDQPSTNAIKDSLKQAESVAVPRAAMAQSEDDK